MKWIIAGSRGLSFNSVNNLLWDTINPMLLDEDEDEIVSGGADGVDKIGERFAHGQNIPVTRFPADWERYGKKAGVMRNIEMAKYADGLIAIWDAESRGTKHMIDAMLREGKETHVFILEG